MNVTAIIRTYGNDDFTRATTWALRRYYPDIPIIYADAHPEKWFDAKIPNSRLIWVREASCEDICNLATICVKTPFVLHMDNDVKIIGESALPLLLGVMDKYPKCAASGWYGLKVLDWKRRRAAVGTNFTDHMVLDATQASFSLHRVAFYRQVGGMPKEPFWNIPKRLWEGKNLPGHTGDYSIGSRYKAHGYQVISPKEGLPILHWSQASEWFHPNKNRNPFDKWYFKHVHHLRCNPLNDWETLL